MIEYRCIHQEKNVRVALFSDLRITMIRSVVARFISVKQFGMVRVSTFLCRFSLGRNAENEGKKPTWIPLYHSQNILLSKKKLVCFKIKLR